MIHLPRTAIIGGSHWHVPLYLDAMAQHHEVVIVQDADLDYATSLIPGVAATASVVDALDTTGVELAYVFGPHDHMATACHLAIERGIPFVVEKPAALSLEELTGVVAHATEAGVPATVPFVQRGGPIEAWLRQAGPASYFRSSFIAGPPERYLRNRNPWMLLRKRAGGGAAVNLAPHFIDMFLRLAGAYEEDGSSIPLQVQASFENHLHGREVEDHGTILLRAEDGRAGVIEIGYAFPDSPLKRASGYSSAGDGRYAEVLGDGRSTLVASDGESGESIVDPDSDPLYGDFVTKVATGFRETGRFDGLPTLRELQTVMAIVWKAYENTSSKRGGDVQ